MYNKWRCKSIVILGIVDYIISLVLDLNNIFVISVVRNILACLHCPAVIHERGS